MGVTPDVTCRCARDVFDKLTSSAPAKAPKSSAWARIFTKPRRPRRNVFDAANRVLGFDLASLCFDGPEERLNQTDISQPAIYVTSVACFRAARGSGHDRSGAGRPRTRA